MSGRYSSDRLDGPGVEGVISVGTTAVEVKVGGSPLDDRKVVTIQPEGNSVYWGYTSSVTTSTGTRVFKDQMLGFELTDQATIYLISNDAGGINVRVTESA